MGAVRHSRTGTSVSYGPLPSWRFGGVLLFPPRGSNSTLPVHAGTGDPDPGTLALLGCESPKRGARRRERREHARGPPMAGRMTDPLWRRAIHVRAPRRSMCFSLCRMIRGFPFRVVKASVTSFEKRRPSGHSESERSSGNAGGEEFCYFGRNPRVGGSNPPGKRSFPVAQW